MNCTACRYRWGNQYVTNTFVTAHFYTYGLGSVRNTPAEKASQQLSLGTPELAQAQAAGPKKMVATLIDALPRPGDDLLIERGARW